MTMLQRGWGVKELGTASCRTTFVLNGVQASSLSSRWAFFRAGPTSCAFSPAAGNEIHLWRSAVWRPQSDALLHV